MSKSDSFPAPTLRTSNVMRYKEASPAPHFVTYCVTSTVWRAAAETESRKRGQALGFGVGDLDEAPLYFTDRLDGTTQDHDRPGPRCP